MLSGQKILISGVTGTVAKPLATFLAKENEVWGLARFADPVERKKEEFVATASDSQRFIAPREELEAAGVTTRRVDLASADFGDLPTDFTYVLHLAWMRANLAD